MWARRQEACGNGMPPRRGRGGAAAGPKQGHEISPTLEMKLTGKGARCEKGGRGLVQVGGRGAKNTQIPTNAGDGHEKDEALLAALHDSKLTHQQHSSDTSGLSDVPRRTQIEMLNAQLLSFLRVVVDVPDDGDCLFLALIHMWNAEVGVNGPEAPWIVQARERGESISSTPTAQAHQLLLRKAMVEDMLAQLEQKTGEVTFTADDARKFKEPCEWGDEVCMPPLTRVLRANIKVIPVQPLEHELYYEFLDADGTPSEYTLVIGWINGLHYTATERISGSVGCDQEGHRIYESVSFDWGAPTVQDEYDSGSRDMPTLKPLHDLQWYAHATVSDGDCMPDSLAACSHRAEFWFSRKKWPWPPDFPMNAAAWRTYLCGYIKDNNAAFTIHPKWTGEGKEVNLDHVLGGPTGSGTGSGLTQRGTWMHCWLLHIAATKFATLKMPNCTFDDGSPAHVRLFLVQPYDHRDNKRRGVFQWVRPCNVHEWPGKTKWTTKKIEKVDASRFGDAKKELDQYMNIGKPYVDAKFEPLLHDAVIVYEPAHHFMYCAPANLNNRLHSISNLVAGPEIPLALAPTWEVRADPQQETTTSTSGAESKRGEAASQNVGSVKRQKHHHLPHPFRDKVKSAVARSDKMTKLLSHPANKWGAAIVLSQREDVELQCPQELREPLLHCIVAAVKKMEQAVPVAQNKHGALPNPADAFVGDFPNGANRLEQPHLVHILNNILRWPKFKKTLQHPPHQLSTKMQEMMKNPAAWSAPAMCKFPQGQGSRLSHKHHTFEEWKTQVCALLTLEAWTSTSADDTGNNSSSSDDSSSSSDDSSSSSGSNRLALDTVMTKAVNKDTNIATCVAMVGLWLNYQHPGIIPCPSSAVWSPVPEFD